MGQPILFVVNNNGTTLEALAHDLAKRFAVDYRIRTEHTPATALAVLQGLDPTEEVALIVAAQRMADMSGVDFLVRAHELHPAAKRVLLVGRREWTASHPAVRAI